MKYRLRDACQLEDEENATFGNCMGRAQRCGVLPPQQGNPVIQSALNLNTVRNDIIHANRARRDSEAALSSSNPEHGVIDIGHGFHVIHDFRLGARDALKDSRAVFIHIKRYKINPLASFPEVPLYAL